MEDLLSSGEVSVLDTAGRRPREDAPLRSRGRAHGGESFRPQEAPRRDFFAPREASSATLRQAGLATLGALGGSFSAPERVGAITSVRRALSASRIALHEALPVLKRLEATPTLDEARAASVMPDEQLALWGTERLVLSGGSRAPRCSKPSFAPARPRSAGCWSPSRSEPCLSTC